MIAKRACGKYHLSKVDNSDAVGSLSLEIDTRGEKLAPSRLLRQRLLRARLPRQHVADAPRHPGAGGQHVPMVGARARLAGVPFPFSLSPQASFRQLSVGTVVA